jgi:hypothetical protein
MNSARKNLRRVVLPMVLAACAGATGARGDAATNGLCRVMARLDCGSRLYGLSRTQWIPLETGSARLKLALQQCRAIRFAPARRVTATLADGTAISGETSADAIEIEALFGAVSVPTKHIEEVAVRTRPESILVEAFIDRPLELLVTTSGLRWQLPPGAGSGPDWRERVWVDGEPWQPVWSAGAQPNQLTQTDVFPLYVSRPRDYSLELLAVSQRRGSVEREQDGYGLRRREQEDGLVVAVQVVPPAGRWYRFRLFRE